MPKHNPWIPNTVLVVAVGKSEPTAGYEIMLRDVGAASCEVGHTQAKRSVL